LVYSQAESFSKWPVRIDLRNHWLYFFVNLASYLIKPPLSFWLVFLLFLISGLILFKYQKRKSSQPEEREKFLFSSKQIKIVLLVAFIIALIQGLIALRTLERDDSQPWHIPSASLMAHGNFPPRDPTGPLAPLAYHYAVDLFSAILYSTTGLPYWLGYDLQTALFSFLIFLLAFILIWQFWPNFWQALVGAFGLLYAGGLNYLTVFPFARVLYQKFIGGMPIDHPFKLLSSIPSGKLTNPLIDRIFNHSPAFGFTVILVILLLFLLFLQRKISWPRFALIGGLIFGFLALCQEIYFVVIFIVLVGIFLAGLAKRIWQRFSLKKPTKPFNRDFLLGLLFFLLIAAMLAYWQGGVLSHLERFMPLFSLKSEPSQGDLTHNIVSSPEAKFTFGKILINFGFPLLLFLPAIFFLKKRVPKEFFFLLFFVPLISFLSPFIVYYLYPRELLHFFYLASAFFALVTSLYLVKFYFELKPKKHWLWLIKLVFILMVLNGLIFQLVYLILPLGKISKERQVLFAAYPKEPMSSLEKRAEFWISKNTDITDWFFVADLEERPYTSINQHFVVLFGRFAPAYHYTINRPVPAIEAQNYKNLIQTCLPEDLRVLQYKYIYIDNSWPKDLEEKCLANNNLALVFQVQDHHEFIRIYRITPYRY
jgi:hypothetical protein